MNQLNHWRELLRCAALTNALATALATALLVGCESVPEAPSEDPRLSWQAQLSWLESLQVWRASGRVAIQVPEDGWSASLRWQQRADGYRIALSGPFGQGAVRIDGTASGVVLRTADGGVQRATSVQQLIAAHLNAEVPVAQLRYWILGRPAPGEKVQELELNSQGRLQRLVQAGWIVTYQEYVAHETGALPKRLQIERAQTVARLVLSSWHTGG